MPRTTDNLPQLFWFDKLSQPEAAIIATDWGNRIALDPILMPDATPEFVAHVIKRGLTHAHDLGFETVQMEVDRDDVVMRDVLRTRGFAIHEDGLIECWINARDLPDISQLQDDYRLSTRSATLSRPHHMIGRSGADVAHRLLATSLYRTDLDLLVLDRDANVAAHGLFWLDPETKTGLVEPMRTEDAHQRCGLARHILTAGIARLAAAGAARIKICFEADNPASSHLYLSVGFKPVKQTDVYSGRTATRA